MDEPDDDSSTRTMGPTFSFYNGDGDFGGSDLQCQVLRSDGKDVKVIHLNNSEQWEEWLKTSEKNLANPDNQITPGYEILLSARVTPISDGIEADLSELPFSQRYWKRIEKFLFVDESILTAMGDNLSPVYSASFSKEINNAAADIYHASNSGSFPGRIAVSSTHFTKSRFTTAVLYGCDNLQMNAVSRILKKSPHMRVHPLLSAALFTELQRERMLKQVTGVLVAINELFNEFQVYSAEERTSRRKFLLSEWSRVFQSRFRRWRFYAGILIEEIKSTQGALKVLLDDMDKSLSPQSDSRPDLRSRTSQSSVEPSLDQQSNTTAGNDQAKLASDDEFRLSEKRLQYRLREIYLDFETMISQCTRRSEDMTFTRDIFMTDINTVLAEAAARDAKASKALGFAAMVYLPITSLATIFAMPIFDWKARWLDHNFHFVPPQPSPTNSSGTGNSTDDPGALAVLSGYFWIYLVVAFVATVFTVGAYMKHTRQDVRRYLQYPGRFSRWVLRIGRII